MLRSDLYDYSDAYIVLKGRISVTGTNTDNKRNKKGSFKNYVRHAGGKGVLKKRTKTNRGRGVKPICTFAL